MSENKGFIKVSFLVLLSVLLVSSAVSAQDVDKALGDWYGSVVNEDLGVDLPIVFHIQKDKSGSLTATMDSPTQGASGITVKNVSFDGKTLAIAMPEINGMYSGELAENGTFKGTWKQNGYDFELVLSKEKPKE